MKKDNCPCKDCPKKGCGAYHDICEDYQSFRKLSEEKPKQEYYKGIRHINVRKSSLKENHIF